MPSGTQNIKMSEKTEILGGNQISIDKDKLKEEHKMLLSNSAFYPSVPIGVERYSKSTIFLLFHLMMSHRKRIGWFI